MYFALIDIDKDGEDEILLGTPGNTDYFGDPIFMTLYIEAENFCLGD